MIMCEKCRNLTAGFTLALGLLYLLVDWGAWKFWNVSWYTSVFLLVGIVMIATGYCEDCKALRGCHIKHCKNPKKKK